MGVAVPLPGRWGSVAGEATVGIDEDELPDWRDEGVEDGIDGPEREDDPDLECAGLGCGGEGDKRQVR